MILSQQEGGAEVSESERSKQSMDYKTLKSFYRQAENDNDVLRGEMGALLVDYERTRTISVDHKGSSLISRDGSPPNDTRYRSIGSR